MTLFCLKRWWGMGYGGKLVVCWVELKARGIDSIPGEDRRAPSRSVSGSHGMLLGGAPRVVYMLGDAQWILDCILPETYSLLILDVCNLLIEQMYQRCCCTYITLTCKCIPSWFKQHVMSHSNMTAMHAFSCTSPNILWITHRLEIISFWMTILTDSSNQD